MQIKTIKSKLKLETGLHIGASDDTMKIGGIDSPVIKRKIFANKENGEVGFGEDYKRPIDEPYIAGSSLKGKIRSLLEHYFKLIDFNGKGNIVDSDSKYGDENKRNLIIKLFGEGSKEDNKKLNITRLILEIVLLQMMLEKLILIIKLNILTLEILVEIILFL